MIDWLQFSVIAVVTVVDELGHEIRVTAEAIRDVYRYRVQWIVREKLRLMFSRKR
jgi:hypothetical protein